MSAEPVDTDLEREVQQTLADVLEVDFLPVDASFFESGGDSLRAVRVISRLYRRYGVELTFEDLFQRPTATDLARAIAQSAR